MNLLRSKLLGLTATLVGVAGCSSPATSLVDGGTYDASMGADAGQPDARRDAPQPRDAGHDGKHDAGHDAEPADAGHDATLDAPVDAPIDASIDAKPDTGPTCDASQAPHDAACVISDAYGVFIASQAFGNDVTGDGTAAHPYATFAKGLAAAKAAGKRLYACATTYAESVVVNAALDGVQVYGGLACPGGGSFPDAGPTDSGVDASVPTWSYIGVPAVIAPTAPGFALDIEGLATGTHFEDVEAVTAAGATPGASSLATMVNASMNVTFTRGGSKAGAGAAGLAASPTASNWCGMVAAGPGNIGEPNDTGGAGGTCTCPLSGGASVGGVGGENNGAGANGTPNVPGHGVGGAANSGSPGGVGANGTASAQLGAAGTMTLTSNGWIVVAAGTSGGPGGIAQGGGGGGGVAFGLGDYISGGGGGAGGCGGTGGAAGGSGGASIAVTVINSSVTFTSVTLVSSQGGAGANGAAGQGGQTGGAGGPALAGSPGPAGGAGGDGAGGNGGGGSAGGPSVGIAWTGQAPTVDGLSENGATTLTLAGPSTFAGGAGGALGAGGGGGASGGTAGTVGGSGVAGVAAAVAQFP